MSSEITLYANRVALPLIEIFETINSISITVTMVFNSKTICQLYIELVHLTSPITTFNITKFFFLFFQSDVHLILSIYFLMSQLHILLILIYVEYHKKCWGIFPA